ncbi:MAG: GNAT family N-acetyltransferase [Phycisphaerae bacterium]|nr:GNAT family N-acetyltransferase [Phycisphaerae bacterium]
MEITELKIEHYQEIFSLWQSAEGVGLDKDVDTQERIGIYLQRNPRLSFAAFEKGKVVGAVLCGHDGRRGYLHHLAVAEEYRNKGTGKLLVEKVISKLRMLGIRKCNTFVFADNVIGREFLEKIGWTERTDLKVLSKVIAP